MIRIRSCSRVHLSLIDLNGSLGRVDGGVGITLNEPYIKLSAERSDEGHVINKGVSEKTCERILSTMEKIGKPMRVEVYADFSPHAGLGWGTQCDLSVARAALELYGDEDGERLTSNQLGELVGRGGTSGIGVAAFERGGFIVDGGHSFSEKKSFAPSSASHVPPPPVLTRYDFPDWELVMATPSLSGAHSKGEVDVFSTYCPIPEEEVGMVARIILMVLMPAIIERDIVAFGDGLNRLQEVGFKRIENSLQQPVVKEVMDVMREGGAYGAGMSSFGPTVLGVCDGEGGQVQKDVEHFLREQEIAGDVWITKGRNKGAEVV